MMIKVSSSSNDAPKIPTTLPHPRTFNIGQQCMSRQNWLSTEARKNIVHSLTIVELTYTTCVKLWWHNYCHYYQTDILSTMMLRIVVWGFSCLVAFCTKFVHCIVPIFNYHQNDMLFTIMVSILVCGNSYLLAFYAKSIQHPKKCCHHCQTFPLLIVSQILIQFLGWCNCKKTNIYTILKYSMAGRQN